MSNPIKSRQGASLGFSMVEVSLALAIVGVAMVSILGLFAVGLDAVKDSTDDNAASLVVQAIVNDRRAADFDLYSTGTSTTGAVSDTTFSLPPLVVGKTNEYPYILYFKKSRGVPSNVWTTVRSVNVSNIGKLQPQYYYEVAVDVNRRTAPLEGFKVLDFRVSWPANVSNQFRTVYFYTTAIADH